jgi:hypothetical protein
MDTIGKTGGPGIAVNTPINAARPTAYLGRHESGLGRVRLRFVHIA